MQYQERVILVDDHDRVLGTEEKLAAHRRALLHRAVSVFVFNPDGAVLLQRRAAGKYHSAGRWSNTCCSHPRPGEEPVDAAHRRLREEMGFDCSMTHAFSFLYRADVGAGLVEHEYDHVFVGWFDGEPAPSADEVDGWRWVMPSELAAELAESPAQYTTWLPIAFAMLQRSAAAAAQSHAPVAARSAP